MVYYDERDDDLMNWTSAAEKFTEKDQLPLARITSIEELCEAQAEIDKSFNYWTALKLNSMGLYQWGHLANNTTKVTEELLDRTEPVDRCYVINKSAMKLLSKDCDSLQGVLLSYPSGGNGKHTYSLPVIKNAFTYFFVLVHSRFEKSMLFILYKV